MEFRTTSELLCATTTRVCNFDNSHVYESANYTSKPDLAEQRSKYVYIECKGSKTYWKLEKERNDNIIIRTCKQVDDRSVFQYYRPSSKYNNNKCQEIEQCISKHDRTHEPLRHKSG